MWLNQTCRLAQSCYNYRQPGGEEKTGGWGSTITKSPREKIKFKRWISFRGEKMWTSCIALSSCTFSMNFLKTLCGHGILFLVFGFLFVCLACSLAGAKQWGPAVRQGWHYREENLDHVRGKNLQSVGPERRGCGGSVWFSAKELTEDAEWPRGQWLGQQRQ